MRLKYDPGDGSTFWDQIAHIPGYPSGESMPIRLMLFEPGALFKLGEVLREVGADPDPARFRRHGYHTHAARRRKPETAACWMCCAGQAGRCSPWK